MKAIATVAFGLASVVGICTAGASIASYVVAEPKHVSPRKDLRPDLWTFEPTRVDQSNQHFERLAPRSIELCERRATKAVIARHGFKCRRCAEDIGPIFGKRRLFATY